MSLPYKQDLIKRAKQMRKDATPQENRLWYDFLRDYPVRFQRQKPIGSFIADFYCFKANLVIEIDGSQHYEKQGLAYDEERTAVLESCGLRVIRFSNADVNRIFSGVCTSIDVAVKEQMQ